MEKSPRINIYLCGSIKKGEADTREAEYFWSEDNEAELIKAIDHDVRLLNPAYSPISRADPIVNFGCDVFLVSVSDVLVVDLRRSKGIGVGAEMMLARQLGIPIIGWLPLGGPYRQRAVANVFGEDLIDWVHPFAAALCDVVCDTLELAGGHVGRKAVHLRLHRPLPEFLNDPVETFKGLYPDFAADVQRDR